MNLFIVSLRIMVRVTLITIIIGSLIMTINSGGGEAAPREGREAPLAEGREAPPANGARSAPFKLGAKRPI